MELIFLHGPAAAGKLTVARELATLTGFRLFHNHLVVDALTAVFAFGTASFNRLREQFWLAVFREAAAQDVLLIFTFAPERTVSPDFIGQTIEAVEAATGRMRFVAFMCPLVELEQRIESAARAEFGKLRSRDLFRELRQSGAFDCPSLPDCGLSIDTSQLSPREAARTICDFFSLPQAAS